MKDMHYYTNFEYIKISELVYNNICPYFVVSYTNAINCNYQSILNILEDEYKGEEKLIRNISYYDEHIPGRPSIDSDVNLYDEKDFEELKSEYSKLKFCFNITEMIDENTTTLHKFLNTEGNEISRGDQYKIAFQATMACYAMHSIQLMHQDLHFGNIFIKKVPTHIITFILSPDISYTLETDIMLYIYDFDRSYMASMGPNPILSEYTHIYGECRKFVPNKDLVLLFNQFKNISFVLSKNEEVRHILENLNFYSINDNYIGNDFFTDKIRPIEETIEILYVKVKQNGFK